MCNLGQHQEEQHLNDRDSKGKNKKGEFLFVEIISENEVRHPEPGYSEFQTK